VRFPFAHERLGEYRPILITLNRSAYYLRFRVEDHPGIIAKVATILAEQGISIDAVSHLPIELARSALRDYRGADHGGQSSKCTGDMAAVKFLLEPPFVMPIEESLNSWLPPSPLNRGYDRSAARRHFRESATTREVGSVIGQSVFLILYRRG